MKKKYVLYVMLLFSCEVFSQGFNLYSDFPSGNVIIDKVKNDTVWIRPDLRDTRRDWFYWCFAVSNANGKTLTFTFSKPNVFTVKGPAVSSDLGFNWKWLSSETVSQQSFSYTFETDHEVRFSMGMPYTQKQFEMFIRPYLISDFVTLDTLAKTKSGRYIERLTIKPINNKIKYKVLVTARHHACEMMANYEIEGMVQEILNDHWLNTNIEFCIIPFMDKDGVENGDQGKYRFPRDHNRDYDGESIYVSTAALRSWVPNWAKGKLAVCLDLHCPWIKGGDAESIYMPGSDNKKIADQQILFGKLLKTTNKGELKISEEKIYFPFGTGWNIAKNFNQGLNFDRWAASIEGVRLPMTIEFPYGNNEGQTITQDNSRAFGKDLAQALKRYLKQL
jgi:hypothetical protein